MGARNNVLTKEQKEEIVSLYNDGLSTNKIASQYGVYSNAIRGLLLRRGVVFRSATEANRKYEINETFFDIIDTEEKAYILGLFYADGSNNEKRHKSYIMLAEQDKDILEKIQKIISPEKPLLYVIRKENNPNHQNRYMFYIDNMHISKQLAKLGCVSNKTFKIEFPKWLDKKLYSHFIRGYFDGDGHIGIYKNSSQFSIVGTYSFCLSLEKIFSNMDVQTKIYCRFPERNNNTRDIRITKRKNILVVLNWLYKDATIYMDRKYNKYLELKAKNEKVI